MIARPTSTSASLQQAYFSYPYYEELSYIPYTTEACLYDQPTFHSDKRLKVQPQFDPFYAQPFDNTSGINTTAYGNMQRSQLRTPVSSLSASHINSQRSSQPGSPATVATTASQSFTPSPSPSRVTILTSDNSNSNSDWQLYDDSQNNLVHEQRPSKGNQSPHHYQHQHSSDPRFNPIMLDSSSYANSGYYSSYSQNQNTQMADFAKLPQQQPHGATHNFLKPSYPKSYREMCGPSLGQQEMTDDCDELPALSPSSYKGARSGRPSISEGDYHSPITPIDSPLSGNGAQTFQARTPTIHMQNPVPKLNRTVSDALEDELFHNDNAMEDYGQSPKGAYANSANPQLVRCFQAAQKQHSLAQRSMNSQLPVGRETSPFRANSPFHPGRGQVSPVPPVRHSNGSLIPGFSTARAQREHQQEMENAALLHQQLQEQVDGGSITPKTISPKDALLDYPEPEDEASKVSLFAEVHSTNGNGSRPGSYAGSDFGEEEDHDFSGIATSRRGSGASSVPSVDAYTTFRPMSLATFPYLHLPAQVQQQSSSNGPSPTTSQVSDQQSKPSSPMTKPVDSRADTGAYSCTDPSCSLRFPTPQKMQKHRREAHRNTTPSSRHPGPHRCTRINPTTGKPCNTVFSRPYDLTRHEDTIHNTAREKVRCELCNDEKTFSRQDALTRHKKVKHGIEK